MPTTLTARAMSDRVRTCCSQGPIGQGRSQMRAKGEASWRQEDASRHCAVLQLGAHDVLWQVQLAQQLGQVVQIHCTNAHPHVLIVEKEHGSPVHASRKAARLRRAE